MRLHSLLGCSLGMVLACSSGEKPAEAPPPPPPPAEEAPAPEAAPAAADSIGVPECDEYVAKMTACMGTMDPAAKAAMESGFKMNVDAWKAASATPEGKEGLARAARPRSTRCPPGAARRRRLPRTPPRRRRRAPRR